MVDNADFLVEIGTEELPPKALRALRDAFVAGMAEELDANRLAHASLTGYASPRRLAVMVSELARSQDDRVIELKGPPVAVAFDGKGNPTPAAQAFADKCGVDVAALERRATDKGEWLYHSSNERGTRSDELLGGIVEAALKRLPIPRPMRWGEGDAEFVRPVHWVLMLHGDEPVGARLFGKEAGSETRGHRFHAPEPVSLALPAGYAELLLKQGRVVADLDERLDRVRHGVEAAATQLGGKAVGDDALYDEVAALVEWPVPVVGSFDAGFLELPREVVVATLTNHQRYFPVENSKGELLPSFITVSNIDSEDPQQVREGNERVIRPRLADAAFFWKSDRKKPLASRIPMLHRVVYQQGLGSIGDKTERVATLAAYVAGELGFDIEVARRAAELAKCDLLTGMVGEFPELQGTMGQYYADASGEPKQVSVAVGEQYMPRFAGDDIPASDAGRCLAIAEKLDTICGIFSLGRKPSGNRDPFGLRRGALGIVRIMVEGEFDLELDPLISKAITAQPVSAEADTAVAVKEFIVDRLRAYAQDQLSVGSEMFEAVRDRAPATLLDFVARLLAVKGFVAMDEAASLASANKRIGNILRQADFDGGTLDAGCLEEAAEQDLAEALATAKTEVLPLLERRDYARALARLATLRPSVDRFFDEVMVMTEDATLRNNRLSLLDELRALFLGIADISRLAIK